MTKERELVILDKAITLLGRDSYLGPWLSSMRAEIEAAITSDLEPPLVTPAEAYREAAAIIQRARDEAQQIREQAQKHAATIRADAQRACDDTRARAWGDLHRAIKALA